MNSQARTGSSNRPLVLAGTGRGGTSWLHDLLSSDRGYRAIFEPLHPYNVRLAEPFYDRYLTDTDQEPSLERFFEDVFYSHAREGWLKWMTFRHARNESIARLIGTSLYYFGRYKPFAHTRVIKIIKGNLMLRWLVRHFDTGLVFLIRHPCACVASQRKMGWSLDTERYSNQSRLVAEFFPDKLPTIRRSTTPLERLTVRWAIENIVPIRQMEAGLLPRCLFFFEDLVRWPEATLRGILDALGIPESDKETFVSRMRSQLPPHEQTLAGWQRRLSNDERDAVLGIVREFGITLYDESPVPVERSIFGPAPSA